MPDNACHFHQYGHCRYGSHCRRSHTKETCSSFPCYNATCMKRHPKLCKYFSMSGLCKFKQTCSFLHFQPGREELKTQEIEIEKLNDEVEALKKQVSDLKAAIDEILNSEKVLITNQTILSSNPSSNVTVVSSKYSNNISVSSDDKIPQLDGAVSMESSSFQDLPEKSTRFQCETCLTFFMSKHLLDEHNDDHNFCCDDCYICYKSQEEADLHELAVHPDTHYACTYIPQSTRMLFLRSQQNE